MDNLKGVFTIQNIVYLVAVFAVAVLIMLALKSIRKNAEAELSNLLYVKNDIRTYFALLENKRLNLVFRKSTILIYKLDGYLVLGSDKEIGLMFDEISKIKLEPQEKIEFNMKKLSYYATKGDREKCESALSCIEKIFAKEKKYTYMIEEARLIFDVYINKNVNMISKIKASVKKENNTIRKGISLYRIAKLEHFNGNDSKANEALLEARKYLKGTHWLEICNSAIEDKDVLNYK